MSQLRRGVLEYCVLALLRRRDHYGFELIQRLSDGDGIVVTEGTIYPLLSRLRREDLVSTFWQQSASGPPRRYYRLTAAGQAALGEFADHWARFRVTVDRLLYEGDHHAETGPGRRPNTAERGSDADRGVPPAAPDRSG